MMKVTNLEIADYGSKPSGHVSLSGDGNYVRIDLSENDCARIFNLGLEIFFARQAELAQKVLDIAPPMLITHSPEIVEAETVLTAQDDESF